MSDYNYRKLRGRIVEKYNTMKDFAAVIGLSEVSVSNKINGKAPFKQSDMEKWASALEIPIKEYGLYFFT